MVAVPLAADVAGLLRLLADLADHRIAVGMLERHAVIGLDLPEALREGDVLAGRQVLATEENDAMFVERVADLPVGQVLQRLPEIDSSNLRAGRCRQRTDINRGVLHERFSPTQAATVDKPVASPSVTSYHHSDECHRRPLSSAA